MGNGSVDNSVASLSMSLSDGIKKKEKPQSAPSVHSDTEVVRDMSESSRGSHNSRRNNYQLAKQDSNGDIL